ncbi:hypothetical protein [Streptomyces lavendulocolor]|uniref:hypothetical protein n=1 Tax=Streptomyces lavendulocolor TaxID=67316 RepID=UPI003C304ADC
MDDQLGGTRSSDHCLTGDTIFTAWAGRALRSAGSTATSWQSSWTCPLTAARSASRS